MIALALIQVSELPITKQGCYTASPRGFSTKSYKIFIVTSSKALVPSSFLLLLVRHLLLVAMHLLLLAFFTRKMREM